MTTPGNHERRGFRLRKDVEEENRRAWARWEELFLSENPNHRRQALEILAADPESIVAGLKMRLRQYKHHQREEAEFAQWLREGEDSAASIARLLSPEYDEVTATARHWRMYWKPPNHPYRLLRVLCQDLAEFLEGGNLFGQSSYKILLRHPLLNRKQRRSLTKKNRQKAGDLSEARRDKKKTNLAERFGLKGWSHRLRRSAMISLDEVVHFRSSGHPPRSPVASRCNPAWYAGLTRTGRFNGKP